MDQQPVILVTGSNGQLGKELRKLAPHYPHYRFVFASREDMGLHHYGLVENFFAGLKPAYCINCAAYTAVDKAESEKDAAILVNGEAVGHLAQTCQKFGTRLIHISTDYVFDGERETPYQPTDKTGPINVYGKSKLMGEQLCMKNAPDSIIIRTSWVYSAFGSNFVKTMLRLMKEKPVVRVVNDQVGAPTYAADLAAAILTIIGAERWVPGIFHYSNIGRISWYEFATAIKELTHAQCHVEPITTAQFPTPAMRPKFSLLDTSSFMKVYGIKPVDWKESLKNCLEALGEIKN